MNGKFDDLVNRLAILIVEYNLSREEWLRAAQQATGAYFDPGEGQTDAEQLAEALRHELRDMLPPG